MESFTVMGMTLDQIEIALFDVCFGATVTGMERRSATLIFRPRDLKMREGHAFAVTFGLMSETPSRRAYMILQEPFEAYGREERSQGEILIVEESIGRVKVLLMLREPEAEVLSAVVRWKTKITGSGKDTLALKEIVATSIERYPSTRGISKKAWHAIFSRYEEDGARPDYAAIARATVKSEETVRKAYERYRDTRDDSHET